MCPSNLPANVPLYDGPCRECHGKRVRSALMVALADFIIDADGLVDATTRYAVRPPDNGYGPPCREHGGDDD